MLAEGPASLDFRRLEKDVPHNTGWLSHILAKLEAEGASPVLAVRLDSSPCDGIHVVKIAVPRLRPLLDG